MMRADTSVNAPYYAAFPTPGNGIKTRRTTKDTPGVTLATISSAAPAYLRIARSGDDVLDLHLQQRLVVDAGDRRHPGHPRSPTGPSWTARRSARPTAPRRARPPPTR